MDGKRKMRLLFMTIGDIQSISDQGIYTDLLRTFQEHGHEVSVVCARERRFHQRTELKDECGIHILRVKVGNITKTNLLEKGISTLFISYQFKQAIKKFFGYHKFDLILYSTPPITIEKVVSYIKKRDGAISYLLLKDIFPQNAVDLGLFSKQSFIYRCFRKKEKKLYAISDFIGCLSPANVDYVRKHNSINESKKIELCPNSIEIQEDIITEEDRIRIRENYGIPQDRIVFIYGGNLGKPQGIDHLIQCLKSQEQKDNIFFVIVGAGTEYSKLERYKLESQPRHLRLLPMLPSADYKLLLMSCDIGLVFLDHRFTVPNFPSRLLLYLQARMPVFAITDPNTDLGSIIDKGRFGWWCESKEVSEFCISIDKILKLVATDEFYDFGLHAYEYLKQQYTTELSYKIIMDHLSNQEKLLILSQCFYPSKNRGGSTVSTINLVKSMNQYFDLSILTTYYEMGTGMPYKEVTVGKNRLFDSDVYYLDHNKVSTVWKQMNKIKPDVIFVSSIFSVIHSVPAMLYQKYGDKRVKLIISPRGELLRSALAIKARKKKLFLHMLKQSRLIKKVEFHATSEEERKELQRIFPGQIIHEVRDLNLFQGSLIHERPKKESGSLRIFTTGRFHPIKNIDVAIDVLRRVKGKVQFDIYGPLEDKAYYDTCMRLAAGLESNIKVQYLGSIPQEQIPEIISKYHIYLSPTKNENFGHSIIEALKSGCPVVISDRTPWQKLEQYQAGYSLSLDSMEEFTKAIQFFVDMGDNQYQEWSRNARDYICKELDINKIIEEYMKMFHRG